MAEAGTRSTEHREWNREHVHWLEELTHWKAEREEALELFREIESALRYPDDRWESHRQIMVALEQEVARHQHHLDHGEDDMLEQARHDASRRKHASAKSQHGQLKARHESIMQHVRALHNLLSQS